ncbi:Putative auto-transporter adhesin, head GIN domain [Chryseolinea serpens]|uniref:Putative auto-transporter adhesin, head GIN domain n=1 Tax=Chryseolinea serpens TaxID=947013 RepID=A0A1M5LFE0_9BACT|nr:head GIN domain-containing protein [Chryseolinea serpens]SHG63834.1 Putative auto-transporter adhesin, head GIN domain [Chryseolinea serpens]
MKNLWAIILLVGSTTLIQAQSQTRALGSFSGVKVAEGVDVYLTKGDKESARVETDGIKPDNVITEVSGSYLKVHMRDGSHNKGTVKVYVTYVKIDKLSASSAGSIYSEGAIQASTLEISTSSAGNVEVTVNAESIDISASSAGEAEIKGKTKSLNADASSAGEIDAYDLEAENVTAGASSAGSIRINVSDALTAKASSGGSIRYRGNPNKSITDSSSGGSVKKSS